VGFIGSCGPLDAENGLLLRLFTLYRGRSKRGVPVDAQNGLRGSEMEGA
jgi:hypothetical protein